MVSSDGRGLFSSPFLLKDLSKDVGVSDPFLCFPLQHSHFHHRSAMEESISTSLTRLYWRSLFASLFFFCTFLYDCMSWVP